MGLDQASTSNICFHVHLKEKERLSNGIGCSLFLGPSRPIFAFSQFPSTFPLVHRARKNSIIAFPPLLKDGLRKRFKPLENETPAGKGAEEIGRDNGEKNF